MALKLMLWIWDNLPGRIGGDVFYLSRPTCFNPWTIVVHVNLPWPPFVFCGRGIIWVNDIFGGTTPSIQKYDAGPKIYAILTKCFHVASFHLTYIMYTLPCAMSREISIYCIIAIVDGCKRYILIFLLQCNQQYIPDVVVWGLTFGKKYAIISMDGEKKEKNPRQVALITQRPDKGAWACGVGFRNTYAQ